MAEPAEDTRLEMELADPLALAPVPPSVADFFRAPAEGVRPVIGTQMPGSEHNQVDARTIIVGREVAISGRIASCDRLIIEGGVEAQLQNCENLVILVAGRFSGSSSTENADVHGRFDGDLVVRNRLIIRATGHVSGKISYGKIEIERGGKLSGVIKA